MKHSSIPGKKGGCGEQKEDPCILGIYTAQTQRGR